MLAGTLTQNDMQVVRMWIGGSDFPDLDQLQPLPPGMHLHLPAMSLWDVHCLTRLVSWCSVVLPICIYRYVKVLPLHKGNPAVTSVLFASSVCSSKACDQKLFNCFLLLTRSEG